MGWKFFVVFLTSVVTVCSYTPLSGQGISESDNKKALEAYKNLNDSPIQRKLRREKVWFSGPVLWLPGDVSSEKLELEMKRIKDLGFTMVRYYDIDPGDNDFAPYNFTIMDRWFQAAQKTGVKLIFHPKMERPSLSVLREKYNLTVEEFEGLSPEDSRFYAIMDDLLGPIVKRYKGHPALLAWGGFGEPHPANRYLKEEDKIAFAQFVKRKYKTLDGLNQAWNYYPAEGPIVKSWEEAWKATVSGHVLSSQWVHGFAPPEGERVRIHPVYGAVTDMIRYQCSKEINRVKTCIQILKKIDPETPVTIGSHNILLNQAMLGWDIGTWACLGDLHFSSIHLPWHHNILDGEVLLPTYLMSKMTKDYFKGGWSSAFETTGGAVQFSGGYGNSMSPDLMRTLIFSYLGSGQVNTAFWTWNHRPGGWESGEYGMTSLSGAITPWAAEAGKIARKVKDYASELWEATPEKEVGLLYSWDTDALLLNETERFDLQKPHAPYAGGTKIMGMQSLVGASRVLVNGELPFEYVTEKELLHGIALKYPVIFVPGARAVSDSLYALLTDYVEKGGHLITDVQFGFLDPYGKVRPTGEGKTMEHLFGAWVDMIHDTRTQEMKIDGNPVTGLFADIHSTKATIVKRFDNGTPAITEFYKGRGKATLLGYEAGRNSFLLGNSANEVLVRDRIASTLPLSLKSNADMVVERTFGKVVHVFLFNTSDKDQVFYLEKNGKQFSEARMVLEEKPLDPGFKLNVPVKAGSSVWVRGVVN